jgi:hypothetical protein
LPFNFYIGKKIDVRITISVLHCCVFLSMFTFSTEFVSHGPLGYRFYFNLKNLFSSSCKGGLVVMNPLNFCWENISSSFGSFSFFGGAVLGLNSGHQAC